MQAALVRHAVLAQARDLRFSASSEPHIRVRVDLLHHRVQLQIRRVLRRVVRLLLDGVQELAAAVALVAQRAEGVQVQEGLLAELVAHQQVVARLHQQLDDVLAEDVHLKRAALALVALGELVLVPDQHVVVAVQRPAGQDLVA